MRRALFIPLFLSCLGIPALLSPAQANGGHAKLCAKRSAIVRPHRIETRHFPRRVRVLECGCREHWRPGHYRTIWQRQRSPGFYERVWVPPRFETCIRFGRQVRVLVRKGFYRRVHRPGPVHRVARRIWVPGSFVSLRRCHGH